MRRSQPVVLQLGIQVRWTPPGEPVISESATTIVVNAHGVLLLLAMKVKAGARIFIRNVVTAQDKECRVVRVGDNKHGKSEVAVEFLGADAKFWGWSLLLTTGRRLCSNAKQRRGQERFLMVVAISEAVPA